MQADKFRQGLAKEALKSAQQAIDSGDWTKAKESIIVALATADAALAAEA